MGIIFDLSVAIGTGEFAVSGCFIPGFGNKEGDLFSSGILHGQRFILMTVKTKGIVTPSYSCR
jgi:hypothetical protein